MKNKKSGTDTYNRYIDGMLELISEKGGLSDVNLRMVSKKIGCAHTNAYNYFDGYEGLIFESYDRALDIYGSAVVKDLDQFSDGQECFERFVQNIIMFALNNPGYYRFIGSDDFNIQGLSEKTIMKAIQLKQFFLDIFYAVVKINIEREESDVNANIIMAYLDGELFNIINKRAFPEDQVEKRIMEYTRKLMKMFVSQAIPNESNDTRDESFSCPDYPEYVLEYLD